MKRLLYLLCCVFAALLMSCSSNVEDSTKKKDKEDSSEKVITGSSMGSFVAQRAAVMEFKAGVGISQADVDGISAIFFTYFRPAGYTMVERTQIDRVIDEQGFQRSRLTESQMVRIGQILNVSKIVIGDVNVVMGQYNVDLRVINVESGTIAATEGATFSGASYRNSMQSVAQKLASKIAIPAGPAVSASSASSSSSASARTRSSVETVYGYLHVFPNELGVFQSEPTNVIANINAQKMHGYNDWRLPTNEELSLLLANGYLSGAQYMSKEKTSGMVLLVTTGKTVAEKESELASQGYVDLGLPSRTFWRNANEGGDNTRYTYNEAVNKFGNKLPNEEQLEELKNQCSWAWGAQNGINGYTVTGPNGNSIFFPAAGLRSCDGNVYSVGSYGYYWSSAPNVSENACYLGFYSDGVYMGSLYRCYGRSVRLVQD